MGQRRGMSNRAMQLMSPLDSVFLMAETREHPMHVGGLMLFEPPADAGPQFAGELYRSLVCAEQTLRPEFRKNPATLLGGIISGAWDSEDDVDLEYHVRRSALPAPGRVRELLELTSRLHGSLLDRHRPLWEVHVVEGLDDGRFAVYVKIHHALIDGVSLLRLVGRTLSNDPADPQVRSPWSLPLSSRQRTGEPSARWRELAGVVKGAASIVGSTAKLARATLIEQQLTLPFEAPRTMFNVKIGGARRCASQSWPVDRMIAIKRAAGVTVNDVVLAMSSGALRAYLTEHQALPQHPLVAMVPVSLRTEAEADSGGNMVGAILCNLATDEPDPARRLETISDSMRRNKKVFSELPRAQVLALSAANMAPLMLAAIPGFVSASRPPFNIVISNVPGPAEPMYWGGARLDGNYPLSIALDGQALNITVASNAGNLDFGLVGCRRSVPHLQRLLGHLDTALTDLEHAVGL